MDNIELIIGTYENLILGYKFASNADGSHGLEMSFTDDSHRGTMRCLCVSPNGTLVSSSTDDSIRLHSLVKRKEIGGLFEHSGTVNCITFFKRSHMFTASEDGTVCMWKSRNWEMLRVLKGHKSHVMSVAVHPSGKLGLSVGSDKSLLTWDFVTGKLAFQRKIKEAAQNILFTSKGDHYLLVYQKKIEVCSLEDTKTVQEISTDWRINGVCFLKDEILAVAGDSRQIMLIDVFSGKHILTLDMARTEQDNFTSRVRCICSVVDKGENLLIAATTDGNIKVFKIDLFKKSADVVLFHESRVRLTCMAVYNSTSSSHEEEEQSDIRESKQAKQSAVSKRGKQGQGTTESSRTEKSSDTSSDGGSDDDDDDDDESNATGQQPVPIEQNDESADSDTEEDNESTTKRKQKQHSSQQKQNKKRKLQEQEAGKRMAGTVKVKKFSKRSEVSKNAAAKSKKFKKKKNMKIGKRVL